MNLNMESGNNGSIQQVVESVETVEVVSETERSSLETENSSKMEASTQLSVPSSGVSLAFFLEIKTSDMTCFC